MPPEYICVTFVAPVECLSLWTSLRVSVSAVHAHRRPGLRARLERELAAGGWPGPGRHQAGNPVMVVACSGPPSCSPPSRSELPRPAAACPVPDFKPWPDQSPTTYLSFDAANWNADLDLDPGLADATLESLEDLALVTSPRDSANAHGPPVADSDPPSLPPGARCRVLVPPIM